MVKRGKTIQVNLSNRLLYTFIAIGVLLIAGIGVYALTPGTAPNPGHTIDKVAPPLGCGDGEFLQFIDETIGWACADVSGGSSDWSSITGIPAGFADGVDNGITSESDPTVQSWAKTSNPDIPLGSLVLYDTYSYSTKSNCNTWCSPNECLAALRYSPDNEIACSTSSLITRALSCLCVKRQ